MEVPEERLPGPSRLEEPLRTARTDDPDIRVARVDEPMPPTRAAVPVYLGVRWPGVWTGLFIAMGVLVLLTALGLAVGATSVSSTGTTTQALSRAAAWWGGISFLIALFIGGAVSARWVTGGLTSVLQGALVWVLAVVAVMYLAGAGISLGAQGLFAAIGSPTFNAAMEQMANNMNQANQVGTTGTLNVAQAVAPTAWITFVVLCVSAAAAIIGAVIGRQKEARPIV